MKKILPFALVLCSLTAAAAPEIASYSLEINAVATTDHRTRGVSDSFMKPSMQLSFTLAHESGLVGLLQLDTVSKRLFPEGNGLGITAGGGYRWGDPDSWHYGLGLATERFPGAKLPLTPTVIDFATGEPGGFRGGDFNSNFIVAELGWKLLELRYLHVISKTYRGAHTGTVCGILVAQADPTAGVDCYLRGPADSRGTQLIEAELKIPLNPQTQLLLHAGYQKMKHFREADMPDWRIGVTHKRWGMDFTLEALGARIRERALNEAARADGSMKSMDWAGLAFSVGHKF